MAVVLRCKQCGSVLNEDPSAETRIPCPKCGSKERTMELSATTHIGVTQNATFSAVVPGSLTEAELAALPRWTLVAFAGRCLSQVGPLFRRFWPEAPAHQVAQIEKTIELAESSAEFAGAGGSLPAMKILTMVAYAGDAVMAANRDRSRIPELMSGIERVAKVDLPSGGEVTIAAAIANNTILALAQYLTPTAEEYDDSLQRARAFIRHDYEAAVAAAQENEWDDASPMPNDLFGPVWWWEPPSALAGDPSELVIQLDVPDGMSDDEVLEMVKKTVLEADALYRAGGGQGLKVAGLEITSGTPVPVEAGGPA